jgi:hypothetical protein
MKGKSIQVIFLGCMSLGCTSSCWIAHAQSQIIVGDNVKVSREEDAFDHYEVQGAVDPNHPEHLIACSMASSISGLPVWTVAFVSYDAGHNWSKAVQSNTSNGNEELNSDDPTCTFGPDGSAYFAGVLDEGDRADTFFFRSPDGGKKWLPAIVLFDAYDRPYITVDSGGSKYHGRIYVNHSYRIWDWDAPARLSEGHVGVANGMGLQRSLDGGRTFIGPVARLGLMRASDRTISPGNSVVLSDGTLVSLFFDFHNINHQRGIPPDADGSLKVTFSHNGGESFEDAVKVSDHFEDRSTTRGMITIPNIAVDPGSRAFKDRLYVVWHDSKGRHEEGLISHSADKGKTWSAPARFSALPGRRDSPGPSEYQTSVAVNKDGVVGVMWYESGRDAERGDYWVHFAASLDGGDTWLPIVRVSEAANTLGGSEKWALAGAGIGLTHGDQISVNIFRNTWQSSGHTAGLAADAHGVFHAFWVDNRTGIRQVWTAPITVSGPVVTNGASELSRFECISSKVKVEIDNVALDETTSQLSFTIRLQNISQETITGPLKMRIINLVSELWTPVIINADNGLSGNGAILEFSGKPPNGVLGAAELSAEKKLELKLLDFKPFSSIQEWRGSLIRFDVRIFARSSSLADVK